MLSPQMEHLHKTRHTFDALFMAALVFLPETVAEKVISLLASAVEAVAFIKAQQASWFARSSCSKLRILHRSLLVGPLPITLLQKLG
jgi:hypothetical protein